MEKLDKLKALLELTQNDTITPKELEKFINMVLGVIKASKDNFDKLSSDNIQVIKDSIQYIESSYAKSISELEDSKSNLNKEITNVKDKFNSELSAVQLLISELQNIEVKDGKDGYDGKDGLDGKDGSPDTGEDIANKLEALEGEAKLDFKALKNVPLFKGGKNGGVVGRNLYQLLDVSITTPTSGQVLKYNSTTGLWENGTDGGSSLAIGATITGATAGSVLFAGASGVLAQDNANFFWDDTNNRLGLGTTSPTQPLDVVGNIKSSGSIYFGNGSHYLTSDNATYAMLSSNRDVQLAISGAAKLTVQASTGNVGIGTTTPLTSLHVGAGADAISVAGTSFLLSNAGATYASIRDSANDVELLYGANSSNGFIGTYTNNNLTFTTNNAARMTILAAGNVGIGTTSPGALLHVSGTAANPLLIERTTASSNVTAQFKNATASWYAGQTDQGTFGIGTNAALGASTIFNIGTAGNVGIGTSSPQSPLVVVAPTNSNAIQLYRNSTTTNDFVVFGARISSSQTSSNSAEIYIQRTNLPNNGDSAFLFRNTKSGTMGESMRIDGYGKVGIGTTSPGQKLEVNGVVRISGDATHYAELSQSTGNGTPLSLSFSKPAGEYGSYLDVLQSHQYYGFLMHGTTGIGGGTDSWGGQGLDASGNFGISLSATSKDMVFYGGNFSSEIMRLKGTGNIGIGTTSPAYKLDVQGDIGLGATSATTAHLYMNSTTRNQVIAASGSSLEFWDGATENARFDANGNFGIGTASPASKLHVAGSGYISTNLYIGTGGSEKIYSGTPSSPYSYIELYDAGTGDMTFYSTFGSADINFNTANSSTPKMKIQYDGNVGIGTTSPASALDVYGSGRFYGNDGHTYLRVFSGGAAKDSKMLFGNTAERFAMGINASANNLTIASSNGGTPTSVTVDYTTGATTFGASVATPYVAKTANYTATSSDHTINCTANTFTITLPTAVGITGRIYVIKNTGTGVITVDANSTETIDGQLTLSINQWEKLTIQSTGAGWIVI